MDRTYSNISNTIAQKGKKHLPALLADCALQYPSNIALRFDELSFTYKQINNSANQLANFLLSHSIHTEDRIGIALDRSPEMLITILAIVKTGAAYLPLDPEYPNDRIEFMLADSSAQILITQKKYANRFKSTVKQIFVEDIWPFLNDFDTTDPTIEIKDEDLAYILYTSGSTGKPKGAQIEHHSLTNLLLSIQKEPGITHQDVLLSVTTISFDIAAVELFLPLISGATLIITHTETAKDSRVLLKMLKALNVTIMQATPNMWRMMLEAGWEEVLPLKIFCGGEALTKQLANSLLVRCGSLWNMYGPTETTIYSIITQVFTEDEVIAIGHPVDNTVVYLLDEFNYQVIEGKEGEICIGGEGVSRGYLNRPELNADKFINYQVDDHQYIRLYKTGDIGKFLPNGDIQCLGRADQQVKIRGYRIELGEIENVIQNSGLVNQAVVVAREGDDNNTSLIAYATPNLNTLRLKEKELYKKQVDNWEKVYDVEYEHSESALQAETTAQFNTNIWKDSFTIKTIPVPQMQQWLTDITRVILTEKPSNILEIGCGTGLIYYQIAPFIKKYIGTDFSRSGINAINNEINKQADKYPDTKLMVCPAHEIKLSPDEDVDTIIINSVIQYFPGEEYLSEVIDKSINLLKGSGKIIIGDVRDSRLLNAFKSYLFLSKLPADTDKKEFKYIVDQEILKEEELCVAPEYFYNLKLTHPDITHVDIQWKQGDYINELIAYRYTVVIYIGINQTTVNPEWADYNAQTHIRKQIESKQPVIALSNTPNYRLAKESLLEKGINNKSIYQTGDLSTYISTENKECEEVLEIISLAKAHGYCCKFYVNPDPLKINLLLETQPNNDCFIQEDYNTSTDKKVHFTNIPLLSSLSILVQRDIYKILFENLPNFMIPANLTIVSNLPLTNNGKIDRQFLSKRGNQYRTQTTKYREPRNEIEKKLILIWQELLGIEKISIDDIFFELGGNSLIAIRMVISLEKETGKDLPLSSLFEYPTIEQLASIIHNTTSLNSSKCLVRLKPEGDRIPLYLVHGWGLTVFIFKDIAKNLHPNQPVFALQGIGIDGSEEPLTKVEDIAARYISEILEQNPTGPYAFGGYSLGGVIACEIAKQLRMMGKQVIMMAMFDAYAHSTEKKLNQDLMGLSLKKVNKFLLRLSHNITQLIKDPHTWNEKMIQVQRKLPKWIKRSNIGKLRKDNDVDFYSNELSKIYFNAAVQSYKLNNYEDKIELFRATKNIYYYMDDPIYLGWHQYAKTVNLHRVKGTHTTMLQPPNDVHFAEILQQCLDNANQAFKEESISKEAVL